MIRHAQSVAVVLALLAVVVTAAANPATAEPQVATAAETETGTQAGDTFAKAFAAATDLMSVDEAAAVDAFIEAAGRFPDDPMAADALFTAARLLDEKLADPAKAAALFRQLVEDFPDSRVALSAERRFQDLERLLGETSRHEAAAQRYRDVLNNFDDTKAAKAVAEVRAIVADAKAWPGAPAALLWMAQVTQRHGDGFAAEQLYAELAATYPTAPEAALAIRGAAEAASSQQAFVRALDYLDKAVISPTDAPGLADTRALILRERLRHRAYLASFGVIAFALLVFVVTIALYAHGWRAIRDALRPPLTAIYVVPVFALLMWGALASHEGIAPAVAIMSVGGIGLTWFSGSALRLAPRRGLIVIGLGLVASVAALAVVYIALHRTRLIDLIIATVRFGPDV